MVCLGQQIKQRHLGTKLHLSGGIQPLLYQLTHHPFKLCLCSRGIQPFLHQLTYHPFVLHICSGGILRQFRFLCDILLCVVID
jgi:hypothetical protein